MQVVTNSPLKTKGMTDGKETSRLTILIYAFNWNIYHA